MSRASEAVLLKDCLKQLRLPAMGRDYPECARQARQGKESYEAFLLDLASRELEQRQANQLKRRLTEARFPVDPNPKNCTKRMLRISQREVL